ncbi:MAG: hypothetical protein JNM79_12280 [Burkholderiales bacterium]|nr:hypothetical protein [Burkholderiales bacterium]
MFVSALRIALAKSVAAPERTALESALPAAEDLERIEAGFVQKINAGKAARGEKPTQLPKARKAQVRGYADDAIAMQKEQLASFESELNSREIVSALHSGLQSDLQFWENSAKYAHPSDLPILEEFVGAKQRLFEALSRCLVAQAGNAAHVASPQKQGVDR